MATELKIKYDFMSDSSVLFNAKSALTDRLNRLNAEQREAVDLPPSDSVKIMAPAGSGKTATIINKAIKLSVTDRIKPERIICITFTRKAAGEMKTRYLDFLKSCGAPVDNKEYDVITPHFSTIHSIQWSFLFRHLGMFGSSILSEYQSFKLFQTCLKKHFPSGVVDNAYAAKMNFLKERIISAHLMPLLIMPVFRETGGFDRLEKSRFSMNRLSQDMEELEINLGCEFDDNEDGFNTFGDFYEDSSLSTVFYKNIQFSRGGFETLLKYESGMNYLKTLIKKSIDILMGIFRQYGLNSNMFPYFRDSLYDYYSQKLSNRSFDFSDMSYMFLSLGLQFPEKLRNIQSHYDMVILDESQDSFPAQFSSIIMMQTDTYNSYTRHLQRELAGRIVKPRNTEIKVNNNMESTEEFDGFIITHV